MKKLLIGLVLAFAIITDCNAGYLNSVTGLSEGTDWKSFIDQIAKSTAKKDAFLSGLGGVRHTQVSLTAAQIIAMYTTPVVLVAAPAAGKAIAVNKAIFTITRTATAFTGGGAAIIQYDSTANGAGTNACDSTLASTVITGSSGTSATLRNGAIISDSSAITAKGLYISNATAVFAAGTGTATVDVWYTVTP